MFGFIKSNNRKESGADPELRRLLDETQNRWFAFLEKMELKMEELCTAAIPELKAMAAQQENLFDRDLDRVQSGVNGQMKHMRSKVYDTYEEKVLDLYEDLNSRIDVLDPNYALLTAFRNACSERYHNHFEQRVVYWNHELEKAAAKDVEAQYQQVLAEFEATKETFACMQCGSPLALDRIYFIATYITCPQCHTQNTYTPGSQARLLEHLARSLAEKRTAHLLEAYNADKNLEYDLYNQMHEVKFSDLPGNAKQAQLAEMERLRQQAIREAPGKYRQYLRAMFNEWNAIVPDLEEQNERFYERMLDDFNRTTH